MKAEIKGVIIKEVSVYKDKRGWLAELFRKDQLKKDIMPRMAYISLTKAGITRGPHMHKYQTDYFCFLGVSKFVLHLWDNRKNSPTFKVHSEILMQENKIVIAVIPPFVVHGYKNIGKKDGLIINFPNRLYAGYNKKAKVDEVRYEEKKNSPFIIE